MGKKISLDAGLKEVQAKLQGQKRVNAPCLLLESEHEIFYGFARRKGWSVGKFMRIASRMLILMEVHKKTATAALEKAIALEMDFRRRPT